MTLPLWLVVLGFVMVGVAFGWFLGTVGERRRIVRLIENNTAIDTVQRIRLVNRILGPLKP